jgi:hypothetical protein
LSAGSANRGDLISKSVEIAHAFASSIPIRLADCEVAPLTKRFRDSEFIDFNTGTVKVAPIQLQFRMKLAGPMRFSDLVRLFQCRIEVWHLGVAVQMLREIEYGQPPSVWSHAAYGLLALLFSYFETIGKTLNPDANNSGTTESDFEVGFRDVYQEITTSSGSSYDPKEFYRRARNGLFSLGSTKRGIWVHNEQSISTKDFDIIRKNPTDAASEKYYVNPHAVTRTVVDHFPTFIARLNEPDAQVEGMRARFEEYFGDFRDA